MAMALWSRELVFTHWILYKILVEWNKLAWDSFGRFGAQFKRYCSSLGEDKNCRQFSIYYVNSLRCREFDFVRQFYWKLFGRWKASIGWGLVDSLKWEMACHRLKKNVELAHNGHIQACLESIVLSTSGRQPNSVKNKNLISKNNDKCLPTHRGRLASTYTCTHVSI